MKTTLLILVSVLALSFLNACGSKKATSEEALTKLDQKFADRVGKARKAELVEYFGTADWCRANESTDGETCRFFKKTGTSWVGDKRDRKSYSAYDEVMAEFDKSGILQKLETNAQR